jgi:hypothetical protein
MVAVFIKDKLPSLKRDGLDIKRDNYKWIIDLFTETAGENLPLKDLATLAELYLNSKIDGFNDYRKHLGSVLEGQDLERAINDMVNNNGKIKDFKIDKAHSYIFYKLKEKYGEDISTGKTSALIMEVLKK